MPQIITTQSVQTAVNLVHRDLIEIGSLVTAAIFEELGWTVLEGVQNKDTNFIFQGNEKIATKYIPGKTSNAILGEALERVLEVKNVSANLLDNLQLYREKEPFDIIGISENGALNIPETEKRIRMIAKRFANQVMRNLVNGDRSRAVGHGYELYDGLNTLAKKDIAAGRIATGEGNLQLLDTIDLTDTSDEAKVAAYELFDAFVLGWDEDLQDADAVNVMMSKKLAQYITQGAALKFNSSVQQVIMQTNNGTSFFDRQNIFIKPTKIMGHGQQMYAYTPGNIVYGSDLSRVGDPAAAHISVTDLGALGDPNILDFFIQCAIGMRIDLINPENFCMALDKAEGGTYNAFKDLKGNVTQGDVLPTPASPIDVTALDVTQFTPEQIAAFKTALGIE